MKEAWKQLEEQLCLSESFDLVCRRLTAPSGEYRFYFVDGFIKDEIVEKLMEFLLTCDAPALPLAALQQELFPYVEVSMAKEAEAAALQVLSGVMTVCREEDSGYVLIDARTYPTRSMNEPEDDRVLRGSRDGFVETLVFNTALIRRRIRDRRLRMAHVQVGETKDDVVICSMAGCRDEALYETLKERLQTLNVHSLTMAQESLSEALLRKHWWNPFPIVRYTERPDVASAHVQEGGIALICDNSPSVALLPASLLDFAQEAQDYYFPPLIGTYLRFIRILVFLLAQFLTPLWFWFNCNPELMPQAMRFTLIEGSANLSVFWQLILLEIGIDAIKLASLNTPSSLSGSFSIIGALILGDFAVQAGWFDAEILLYMAFVALANFTQPSFELGYAIKLTRMLMLVFIALFPFHGLWLSLLLLAVLLFTSRSPGSRGYLYPLIPFDAHACAKMLLRKKISKRQ
ncbi:MAG TPA: spore germination protein [Candidatus Merdibacter merdavium]|uniref:Spore germination protein n=1 Tax=Candidatus Merdibacter merdavium TaxID=2838692 RepID=A0A9D2NPW3_9FIRM|nr:spore germination protein [Candidatus Merdibacter merdavium]